MKELIGRVVSLRNRNEGSHFPDMFLHNIGEEMRPHIDLCRGCKKWSKDPQTNCPINQDYREIEERTETRIARTMCPQFSPRHPAIMVPKRGE